LSACSIVLTTTNFGICRAKPENQAMKAGGGYETVLAQLAGQRLRRALAYVFALLLVLAGTLAGLRHAGRWLIREVGLSPADVILVLSGGMPYRAEEAGKIFQEGFAREVWISSPENPGDELKKLGVRFVAEEDYNREVLLQQGVPESAIHILPDTVVNTEQEVEETAREMRRTQKHFVIIVTSPAHTRRVGVLWKELVGSKPKAIVRAAGEDPFDADHWWRNTRDSLAVLREALGLMNAWAGLPVRPHAQSP
jgi:uncharacterized SAM-binding protein YcdF (DUF218 family)